MIESKLSAIGDVALDNKISSCFWFAFISRSLTGAKVGSFQASEKFLNFTTALYILFPAVGRSRCDGTNGGT
ncbi:hypothetical protein D3C85_1491740 [compost metagenome]